MRRHCTVLGFSAFFVCTSILPAEIEYEIHTSYGNTSKVELPVLISLRGKDAVPVKGAVVALKRLGPDGWTEEEIVREADMRTDKNGMILVMYPGTATRTSSGKFSVEIYGAVTVVAKGHRTVTIELRSYFKDGQYVLSETTVPHLKLELTDQPKDGEKQESNAQQGGAGQPATRPESKPEGRDKPQPASWSVPNNRH